MARDLLVAADNYYAVLAGVRALRAASYRPWVAGYRQGSYAMRSRAAVGTVIVPDPAREPSRFVEALAETARRVSVAAVLPGSESALVALSGNTAPFGDIAVGVDSPEIVARVTDKVEVLRLASVAGLPVPPTTTVTEDDLGRGRQELVYPAIVKPVRSQTPDDDGVLRWASAQAVQQAEELEGVLAAMPGSSWLIQPYIAGKLRAVGGVAWEGKIVCAVHQVAERTYPPAGGSSYAVTIAPDHDLEGRVARLVGLTGLSGIFQVQFVESDTAYFIDLNPRMYGSLALAVAAGLNLPAIWADLLLGRSPEVGAYRVGVRFRAEGRDVRALVSALLNRNARLALRGIVPRPGTVHAVFSVRDPAPVMSGLQKLTRLAHDRSDRRPCRGARIGIRGRRQ